MEKPLRGPALTGAIKEYIKDTILEKKLKPGDPLPPEATLAATLGVGRSSIREAIKTLQAAGIVEVRHGQGLYVREYNLDSILENFDFGIRFSYNTFTDWLQIRIWLEDALIDDVVKITAPRDILKLEAILHEWQASVDQGHHRPDLDQKFHLALYEPFKNHTLVKLIEAFWRAFQSLEYRDLSDISIDDARNTIRDHWQILEGIKTRNPELAKQYLMSGFDKYYDRADKVRKQIDQMK